MKVAKATSTATKLFTTLPNGLRVATMPTYGQFCTVGVAILAGSRNEACFPQGTAHLIEKLAFSGSKKYSRRDSLILMEKCNALVDCQSSKDTFMFASSCRIKSADQILDLIADSVLRPTINEKNMETARCSIRFENDTMERNPDCEPLLTDWIHEAAFRDNTVGLPKYCRTENVDNISAAHALTFLSQFFTAPRIVLAGVGLPQDWLEEVGKQLFNENTSTWATERHRLLREAPPDDNSTAQYTGGELMIEKDLSKMALGPTPFPNLAHVVIGFQGASVVEPDFVPFCVLQSLMGGGGSFSSGGPGKGMYTRLYTNVLNRHHWVYNATAYNHSYNDIGLFCIRGSSDPSRISRMPEIILKEFEQLATERVGDEELARAKTQLKSQLVMNLEMRPVQFEDMARQILTHNLLRHPMEYCDMIDAVIAEDIQRIARRMLGSKLSIVGYGDLRLLPPYEQIRRVVG